MDMDYEPVIDNWYKHPESQLHFCIIDIDETTGILDIQHADGDLDTLDIDNWYESGLELATAPEHGSASLENVSDDEEDNLTSRKAPYNWQYEPASLTEGSSANSQSPEIELQPDAIDERVFLGEEQNEEADTG